MKNPNNTTRLVVYGYGIEVVVAVLIFMLLCRLGWLAPVSSFIDDSAGSWATFFGVMLAGAMAARLVFFNLNNGDFSAWLVWKKLGGVISGVFLFNLLLFVVVTVINLVLVYEKGPGLTVFGVVIDILGLINAVTFPLFVYRLNRLQAVFNFEFKKAMEVEKGKP